MKILVCLVSVLTIAVMVNAAAISDFDSLTLASGSHWGGAGSGETGFTDGDVYYSHNSGEWSWDGFAYSNETDITTAGYTNQFSAYASTSSAGNQYGIGYVPSDWMSETYDPIPQSISLIGSNYDTTISGMWVTNTTYAYLAMRDGDGSADKFGGTEGDAADYFNLLITGIRADTTYTDTVSFALADFTFAENSQDYIIDDWTWVDLSGLGSIVSLEFSFESSDTEDYGIDTPTYFAMDNFNGSEFVAPIPEPTTMVLLGLGALMFRRKK